MTLILVVASFVLIATLRWYMQSRQERIAVAARALGAVSPGMEIRPGQPPAQFLFHPGHTWVHLHESGLATIGVTEFASNFAGTLSGVELPREGYRIRKGESAWTLVSGGHRRVEQSMPIDGKVIAVNPQLLENPDLLQNSPYENGWILRVRPKKSLVLNTDFFSESAVKAWFDAARDTIASRLTPAMGTLAQDGGEWLTAFGDHLDDDEWENLKSDLFPTFGSVTM